MSQKTFLITLLALCSSNCISTSKIAISTDHAHNYDLYFSDMSNPPAEVLNSSVERIERKFLGLFKMATISGSWYFELLASQEWVSNIDPAFKAIPWTEVEIDPDPIWFRPVPDKYEVRRRALTSYPSNHIFIEKSPIAQNRIHIFIRRY